MFKLNKRNKNKKHFQNNEKSKDQESIKNIVCYNVSNIKEIAKASLTKWKSLSWFLVNKLIKKKRILSLPSKIVVKNKHSVKMSLQLSDCLRFIQKYCCI